MRTKILIISLLIIAALLIISCDNRQVPDTSGPGGGTDSEDIIQAVPADAYIFPDLDCGEEDFTFLNITTEWDFYTAIVHEEVTGEVLDDAIFNRNKLIEEKFNVNLKETGINIMSIRDMLRRTIMAGEDIYDAAYCAGQDNNNNIGSLITSGLLHNLNNIAELNLDGNWWNQNIKNDATIGDHDALYFAGCDINIMNLQGAWCVFFNETMFSDLGLDMPYDSVKNGRWTFDEFHGYMKAGARLNGAADFSWDLGGPAIYGMTSYEYGMAALIAASGERYILKDEARMPRLAVENERFYNVSEKIADMMSITGEYQNANNYATGFHFEMIFRDSKAAMLIGEFKAADVFRTMESVYGIVPLPKYNEAQQSYYTIVHNTSPLLVVPVTNNNLSRTGIILDALAYLSHKDVTPIFFDITLSLKRLHNEDSVEMLKIIRDSVFVDLGTVFGWTWDLSSNIFNALDKGSGNVAALIDRQRERIEANINDTMEYFAN